MTENGTRPTAADVAAAFDDAGPVIYLVSDGGREAVLASERAVLGSAIQSAPAAAEAAALLRPEHFDSPAHQLVFEAVTRLADAGDPVEPASVMAELARAGTLAKVGAKGMGTGAAYLHDLMQRAGDVRYHARKILADWQRRNAAVVLKCCQQITEADDWDPDVHLDEIRRRVMDATAFAGPSALRPQSETVLGVLDALEQGIDPGLSTGYPDLDDAIGGLRPGELTVAGARPGVGKSVLGLNIADHLSTRLQVPGLFASQEMREEELTHRRIAAAATVNLTHLTRHQVSEFDWEQIRRAWDRLTASQMRVDDTPGVSLAQVRGRLREMDREGCAARWLVADYLGIFAAPKAESRQQAVAELARGFKLIAREFEIPVFLLAQLNRSPEGRADKKPVLSDLRESGEIEAAADIVILLHREDAYERESPRAGEIDLIIAKNRQGPLCTVTLTFQGHYGRIVSGLGREWSPSGGTA